MSTALRHLLICVAMCFLSSSFAAEFRTLKYFSASISGKIEIGDTEKLAEFLKKQKSPITSLYLDSPGGSIEEAIRMGELIKILFIGTVVKHGEYCTSACFFLFLAGSDRQASPAELMRPGELEAIEALARSAGVDRPVAIPGFVGLHRPFFTELNSLENQQVPMMKRVMVYLENQMISRRLIDLMMSRPSNDIYWLTEVDLKEIGNYPPEQEEFFIKKCGLDRNSIEKQVNALQLGNRADADTIQAKADKASACIAEASSSASATGYGKLRGGWLPSRFDAVGVGK